MENNNESKIEKRLLILESMISEIYDEIIPKDSRKICPVCGQIVRLYLPVKCGDGSDTYRRDVKCPVCSSYNRHRAYALFLNMIDNIFDKNELKLLHFAPEKCFYDKFSNMKNVDYYPVDINPNVRGIRAVVDITDIPYEDETFDFIMCTHVLGHILDDKKAMSELYRVLKKGGHALINVPINNIYEHSFENLEYNTPELREKYFGQADHVRWYGKDFPKLLEKNGFQVEEVTPFIDADEAFLKKNGVYSWEKIHWCVK